MLRASARLEKTLLQFLTWLSNCLILPSTRLGRVAVRDESFGQVAERVEWFMGQEKNMAASAWASNFYP